jgi:hypothetical protein
MKTVGFKPGFRYCVRVFLDVRALIAMVYGFNSDERKRRAEGG